MRSKRFLSHLILTLSWWLKYKTRSRWEKFASSYNPFSRVSQITIRAAARIARNTTRISPWNGEERCPWRNQRRAARIAWVQWEPSTPRRDPRTGGLVRSGRCAQPFFPDHCRSEHNRACLPRTLWNSSWEGVTHSVQLWVVQKFQFQWERISSAVQPRRSLRGSEVEPSASSWCSSFRGRERSLDPRMLRRVGQHSRRTSASPNGLCWPSAFGSDLRRGKVRLAFRLHTASRIGPSIQVFQQASGSPDQAYPDPRYAYVGCRPVYESSAFGLPRAIWRGIVEAPDDVPSAEEVHPIGK